MVVSSLQASFCDFKASSIHSSRGLYFFPVCFLDTIVKTKTIMSIQIIILNSNTIPMGVAGTNSLCDMSK